jgi:hypothetical protein
MRENVSGPVGGMGVSPLDDDWTIEKSDCLHPSKQVVYNNNKLVL